MPIAELAGWKRRCVPPPIQSPGSLNIVTNVVGAAAAIAGPASAHAEAATTATTSFRRLPAIPLLRQRVLGSREKGRRPEPPPSPCSRCYATSLRATESASARSFFRLWFSIWRIRSRVTLNARPTSSSVQGCSPFSPTRERIRQIENQGLKKLRALADAQKLRDVA